MRKYTRFLALLLALAMILSCSTSAFAENAGSADEYYRFIHEYLNEQRRLENWTPEIFLSEQAVVSEGFTRPAPFMPPVSATASTFALAKMSANDYGIALIDENAEDPDGNNLVTSKTTIKTDAGYKVRIEAFATGTTTTIQQDKAIPADIILVLDQSGSMANSFNVKIEAGYHEYGKNLTNDDYWKLINADKKTVWYKVSDQQWVQVQVEKVYTGNPEYSQISKPDRWEEGTYREKLLNMADSGDLYYLVNGNYVQVLVERYTNYYSYYRYYYMNGTQKVVIEEDLYVNYGAPQKTYYENKQPYTYRYFYTVDTNENGQYDEGVDAKVIIVENSAGKTTAPLPFGTDDSFYYYETTNNDNGQTTNLQALKDAVTTFADQVAAKAAADKVNHRLAIVGFASQSGNGNNTEILTVSGTNSGSVGVQYNNLDDSDYQNAFQDMSTEPGKTMVTNAINALTAQGATEADLGMEMAVNIFAKDLYTPKEGEVRNKVVIMFTDGSPTTYDGFDGSVANDAIGHAKKLKDKNITVYTVGIFNGAKLTKPITLENLPKYEQNDSNRENRFMHLVSSNYLKAETMDSTGNEVNPNIGDGSYYLPATNASELNDIFTSISSNIQSGSTSVTLDGNSTVKDIVSDFFVPINGNATQITVKTADYAGMTDGVRKWTNEQTAAGVTPTIDGNTVSVKGFDFKANYVATVNDVPQGQKLIIEFDIKPATGFLGGNDVPTNGAESGIYGADGSKAELFEIPKVNVPIVTPTVDVTDKNVYLLDDLTMAQLYPNGTIVVKDANGASVTLDYTKTNGGLAEWQIAHVDFNITLSNSAGMENLLEDVKFSASVSIAPKVTNPVSQEGTKAEATGEIKDTAQINVFKPELTFKDGQVDYMSAIDAEKYLYNNTEKTYEVNNRDGNAVWKHGETVATNMGNPPALSLAYNPTSGVVNNNVTSTTYVPMQVTVKIGDTPVTEHVTFKHTETCPDTACEWESVTKKSKGNPAFLLHVENVNGDLKITKTVNWNGKYDEAQTFLFKVEGKKVDNSSIDPIWVSISFTYSDGKTKSETIIVEDLPAGTYTVTEIPADQRYTMNAEGNTGMVVNGTVIPEAKFTNTLINDKWLDDEYSVDNTFNDVTTQESTN